MRNTQYTNWIMKRKLKNVKNESKKLQNLEYGVKTDKRGKSETHMLTPGISQETLKNVENETLTLYDQEYGEKHSKTWKMRNAQCRTWNMARILENVKIEKRTW